MEHALGSMDYLRKRDSGGICFAFRLIRVAVAAIKVNDNRASRTDTRSVQKRSSVGYWSGYPLLPRYAESQQRYNEMMKRAY